MRKIFIRHQNVVEKIARTPLVKSETIRTLELMNLNDNGNSDMCYIMYVSN
jgi:hypothetical protein